MSQELYWSLDSYEYAPSETFSYDEVVEGVIGNPDTMDYWDSSCQCIDNENNCWEGVDCLDIFSKRELGFSMLPWQMVTDIRKVIMTTGITNTYNIGEIQLECLVKYHENSQYYSFTKRVQTRLNAGKIVAFRILNPEILSILEERKNAKEEEIEAYEKSWNNKGAVDALLNELGINTDSEEE